VTSPHLAPFAEPIAATAVPAVRERIPLAEPDLRGNELAYVIDCVQSGWISSIGPYVNRFEAGLAQLVGAGRALTTSNGTVALHLALAALRIGPGDEVLVPDLTFAATANAVLYCGATPVLVDVREEDWGIDPELAAQAITPRTRAILPVHLYGHPCDMERLCELARAHRLAIVEDAAEALGATYDGRPVGSFGDISCFSFYGNKLITTGEGGACLTSRPELAERMSFLRDHGMDKSRRYWHEEVGFNYRMTSLQAAVGLAQLERIEELIAARRRNAAVYRERLAGLPVGLSPETPRVRSTFWMFNLVLGDEPSWERDRVIRELAAAGVETRAVFYPLHQMPPYARFARPGQAFPVATRLGERGLSLPSATTLRPAEIDHVADAVRRVLGAAPCPTFRSSSTTSA
jgi:perosamine synthetase